MVSAYILLKLEAGRDKEVSAKLEKIRQIIEACTTYGAYDMLVKVKFDAAEELDRFIFDVVRRIPGVAETVTMFVAKAIVP